MSGDRRGTEPQLLQAPGLEQDNPRVSQPLCKPLRGYVFLPSPPLPSPAEGIELQGSDRRAEALEQGQAERADARVTSKHIFQAKRPWPAQY